MTKQSLLKMNLQTFAKPQGSDVSTFLNNVWHTSSNAYQDAVPLATADNIKDVGQAVLNLPPAERNAFMSNVYNKIGLTLVEYPVVNNHLEFLRKGTLEYGQTIEDLYVGLANAVPYVTGMADEDVAAGNYPDPFKVHKVKHRSAFYHTILSRQYPLTRHLTDLKKAFHSSAGLDQFFAGLMNAMVSREKYDDYRMTVALMARQIEAVQSLEDFHGNIHLLTLFNEGRPAEEQVTAETAFSSRAFLQFFSNQLKKWSKRLKYLRSDLNVANVENNLPKERQRIMMLEDITTDFETELLAWAYNSGNLDIGGIDGIDAWYSIGAEAESTEGIVLSPDDIKVRSTFTTAEGGATQCAAVIYDPEMLKIYNKEHIASEQHNAAGNYWNMYNSLEDIFAASPYSNFICFMLD